VRWREIDTAGGRCALITVAGNPVLSTQLAADAALDARVHGVVDIYLNERPARRT